MSKSVNRVTLLGRLTKEVNSKQTTSGIAVAELDLATNEKYKDRNGEWKEDTQYHRVILWQRLAELAAEYLHKGNQVYIEGKLTTRSYEKDGQKKYVTEVKASELVLLDKNESSSGQAAPVAGNGVEDDSAPF